jgi:hypothetical protein
MKRWWDDAGESLGILDRVDDSDVVQGVGTALLGYHGLGTGVLRPLVQATLVDERAVCDALASIDLVPVAKALAEATRPVMGDASDRYGVLLAHDMHERAVDSTTRFVRSLTATGMDWPSALSRAADIHGVPSDQMGVAGERLRAQRLPVAAQQDWADRALVGYAAHVGKREADGVVSKSIRIRTDSWDERDHPRDDDGQFTAKTRASTSGGDDGIGSLRRAGKSRKARLESRRRRMSRGSRTSSSNGVVFAGSSTGDVAFAGSGGDETPVGARSRQVSVREQQPSARERIADRRRTRIQDRRRAARRERINALLTSEPPETPDSFSGGLGNPFPNEPRDGNGKYFGHRMVQRRDLYMLIPGHLAEEIAKDGAFNVGRVAETRWPGEMSALTAKELKVEIAELQERDKAMRAAGEHVHNPVGSQVIIRFVGKEMAWAPNSSSHKDDESEIATGATFKVLRDNADLHSPEWLEVNATDFTWRATAASPSKKFRSMSVKLDNQDEFAFQGSDNDGYGDDEDDDDETPPLPYDTLHLFGKEDDWNESLHPRDTDGTFRAKGSGLNGVEWNRDEAWAAYRKARNERLAKRRKRLARQVRQARKASDRVGVQFAGSSGLADVADARTDTAISGDRVTPAPSRAQGSRERIRQRIRDRRRERMHERRKALRDTGYKGDPANDLTGLSAAFPADADAAFLLRVGEDGGTVDDEKPFKKIISSLISRSMQGKESIAILDKDRSPGRELVAMPEYESPVPVFDTANEADEFAVQYISSIYDAWDSDEKLPRRLSEFIQESEQAGVHVFSKAVPHDTLKGKWVPMMFWSAPSFEAQQIIVATDAQWKRAALGEIPTFVASDPVPMSQMLAANGYGAERIETTNDDLVQVIRMDFMDNVRH